MKYHFTPYKGWTNDPNGTVYIDGQYHLFYQHYPDGLVWGPMHWGHAVSRDGVNWEHKSIALYPDELGYIFSGSCYLDVNNDSGLGSLDNPPLIAAYTSHEIESGIERQSIAYSLDYENFIKYEGNPVIDNSPEDEVNYRKDFRDPKIIANKIIGGYTCVLAAGNSICFYHSVDFIHWDKTGEVDFKKYGLVGICECPDLICFEDKYVLTCSFVYDESSPYADPSNNMTHIEPYFVGEFDGLCFKTLDDGLHNSDSESKYRLIDYGPDNYATVSFARTSDVQLIGWGENWRYVNDTPVGVSDASGELYRGKMTLIKSAKLIETELGGYALSMAPIGVQYSARYTLNPGEEICINNISQENSGTFTIRVTDTEIIVDRSACIPQNASEVLHESRYQIFKSDRVYTGSCDINIVEDDQYYEIYADQGTAVFSVGTKL